MPADEITRQDRTAPELCLRKDALLSLTLQHRLVLPADANHHGTLYAGSLLRIALEAGYATAWRHCGPQANLLLRRVLNLECLRPVPVGTVIEIQGAVLHAARAYLVTGLLGTPLEKGQRPDDLPATGNAIETPDSEPWLRLAKRLNALLKLR
jgi:acyl-CoA hydrolase